MSNSQVVQDQMNGICLQVSMSAWSKDGSRSHLLTMKVNMLWRLGCARAGLELFTSRRLACICDLTKK